MEKQIARESALIYSAISFGLALLFFLATFFTGEQYNAVARYGGTIWVFILTMIITMPLVIPAVKKKYGDNSPSSHH
ncbi:hypothetical protein [Zhaonella formicivorans]|jgi:hypothetical protein|uniref:hypothetical protein n=1 Tax=Zhaonella formicivorans TaxID=2528593 RepID=UPI0010EC4F50|nr:hypothetical protein [Zhaonella formicivorans]